MKRLGAVLLALFGAGCQTTRDAAEVAGPICVPLETKAEFSCWWSAPDAPLSHCILLREDEPRCGLKRKGGDYLNRGATAFFDPKTHPDGSWFVTYVFEDKEGRVGRLGTGTDGVDFLINHSESPIPTVSARPPTRPRFPSGWEFGPEQAKR